MKGILIILPAFTETSVGKGNKKEIIVTQPMVGTFIANHNDEYYMGVCKVLGYEDNQIIVDVNGVPAKFYKKKFFTFGIKTPSGETIPVDYNRDVAEFIRYRIRQEIEFNIKDSKAYIEVTPFKVRFKQIEKFTSFGGYSVNIPFNMVNDKIVDFVSNIRLQLNPDFQRGHVWNEAQQIAYLEYLFKGGKSGLTIYFNHPNWMNDFEKGEFVCVDGLQRLTACMRFLRNEIKVFGAYYKEYDKIDNDVNLIFNINNLKTKKEVLKWYLEMNNGGTIHTEGELNKVRILLENEK